jgi:hypothetical protein
MNFSVIARALGPGGTDFSIASQVNRVSGNIAAHTDIHTHIRRPMRSPNPQMRLTSSAITNLSGLAVKG